MDDLSDEEECKSPRVIQDLSEIFNFSTFFFLEDNHLKINKKLGKITYTHNKKIYKAEHSMDFPKIIFKNKIYNNIKDWLAFVIKTKPE